ncbi:MAG: AAA family ATPase [Parcubacteria group bacterium]|jgi:ATP-dependent Clp protease ATP-binding subunit ClpC
MADLILPIAFIIIVVLGGAVAVFFARKKPTTQNLFSNTPTLDHFSLDLTDLARKGALDPIIGRKEEIDQLTRVLGRRTKNNAVLIGKAGIGKTSIVEGLAQNIINHKVTPDLFEKRLLSLNLNSLMAGTKYRGEFEGRIKKITEEISGSNRNIILFIDEIHNIIEPENSGESISIGDILKPAMARGELQVVGATTLQEYELYFNKDPAFKRRMQPIFVAEPDETETIRILRGIKYKYEQYHQVKFSDEALRACVEKAVGILPDRSFPDKAIDIMDEVASKVKMDFYQNPNKVGYEVAEVKISDVDEVIEEYKKVTV